MKNFLLVVCAPLALLAACGPSTSEKPAAEAVQADSAAVATSLRGFFEWYAANETRLAQFSFTDTTGPHLKLAPAQLQAYLAEIKQSGFVSNELVENETKFYQACERAWANEEKGDVPAGLDADRFYCAQDYLAPYHTGQVRARIMGDRAMATLTLGDGAGGSRDFGYELRKENGKWLLAKLGCDSGVSY
jgi:hypothetical protein